MARQPQEKQTAIYAVRKKADESEKALETAVAELEKLKGTTSTKENNERRKLYMKLFEEEWKKSQAISEELNNLLRGK